MGDRDRMFHVRRRSSFNAALVILLLDVFSYANDWQGPGMTIVWGAIGLFWLSFAFRRGESPKARKDAIARRAFYRHYFGPFAVAAPAIPYLFLFAAFLVMTFLPSARWLVWTLLAVAAAYLAALLFLLTRFLKRRRQELDAHAPEVKEPWQGADGIR